MSQVWSLVDRTAPESTCSMTAFGSRKQTFDPLALRLQDFRGRVGERYRRIDKDLLELRMTLYNPT